MALAHLRGGIDIKINDTLECLRLEMNVTIIGYIEPQVDTLVDGKARHQSVLVVDMSAQGTHTIRGEDMMLHIFYLMNLFLIDELSRVSSSGRSNAHLRFCNSA